MLNRISCLAVLASLSMPVLAAEPSQQNGPIELSLNEMDHVTAGFSASVEVAALGTSPFLAFTSTDAYTITVVGNPSEPALSGAVAVAAGAAQAAAVGDGSDTATSVTPATNLPGATFSSQVNVFAKGEIVEINAVVVIQMSSPMVNPL